MNCPYCQKALPGNYSAAWCPFCGRDLVPDSVPPLQAPKTNWFVFFAVLLAPAIVVLFAGIADAGGIVVLSTFGGSLAAGIACARMLAKRQARGMEANRLLVFVFSIFFAALSFILCFAGCAIPAVLQSSRH